jgi:hypothetical protein
MPTVLPDFRLRQLAEDIAHFTPDLAEFLCRNGELRSDEVGRLQWIEGVFPSDNEPGSLYS